MLLLSSVVARGVIFSNCFDLHVFLPPIHCVQQLYIPVTFIVLIAAIRMLLPAALAIRRLVRYVFFATTMLS